MCLSYPSLLLPESLNVPGRFQMFVVQVPCCNFFLQSCTLLKTNLFSHLNIKDIIIFGYFYDFSRMHVFAMPLVSGFRFPHHFNIVSESPGKES